jgi:GNAT superfamily N-acetyltransferase
MQTGCFACDEIIEADDAEAVADRFLEHGEKNYDWAYPDEALRNFARNWAEAEERLSRHTERLLDIGEITVHPVTEDRIDDWLHFFDHDGFAGNPDWASCYCREPHDPGTEEEPERHWTDNRAVMAERLRTGGTFGYLAYVDGKTAGWVNASPRADYAIFELVDPDGPDPASVIGVSCFVIAPPFRRHGVAAALLDRVIADSAARDASWVEGYPRNEPDDSDAAHFRGPRSMYDARGFEPVEVRQRDTVMRRPVA